MRKSAFKLLIITNSIIGFSACTSAQDFDAGKMEYQSSCAACHGIDGKGNGPVGQDLKTHPSDLTGLAKKNNGVFPYNAVYEIIDGRNSSITSHGTPEMPIWGYRFAPPEAFRLKKADEYTYFPPDPPELVIRSRILAVIDYLNRIQVK